MPTDAAPEFWIVTRPGGRRAYYLLAICSGPEEVARQHLVDFVRRGAWPDRWAEGDSDAGECWYAGGMVAGEIAVWIRRGTIDA